MTSKVAILWRWSRVMVIGYETYNLNIKAENYFISKLVYSVIHWFVFRTSVSKVEGRLKVEMIRRIEWQHVGINGHYIVVIKKKKDVLNIILTFNKPKICGIFFSSIFKGRKDNISMNGKTLRVHWTSLGTSVLLRSYMWRHIDVQKNWRRRWTYGRAPKDISYVPVQAPIRGTLFIRLFQETAYWEERKYNKTCLTIYYANYDKLYLYFILFNQAFVFVEIIDWWYFYAKVGQRFMLF